MEALRPLSHWSTFVLEELPSTIVALEEVKKFAPKKLGEAKTVFENGLSKTYRKAAIRAQVKKLIKSPKLEHLGWQGKYGAKDLALIDLKFVDAAYYRLFGKRLHLIKEDIRLLGGNVGRPEILTYEELVMINPLDDENIRLFSEGARAEAEKLFYREHQKIEAYYDAAFYELRRAKKQIQIEGLSLSGWEAKAISGQKIQFINVMKGVGAIMSGLDRDLFNQFREYLKSYGEKYSADFLPGPSGAYSSSIPNLELVLAGDKSESKYLRYLKKRYLFYPTIHRDIMVELINEADEPSLLTLAEKLDKKLYGEVKSLCEMLKGFRKAHMSLVEERLPEAVQEKTATDFEATGGNSPTMDFLQNRIDKTPLE